MPWSRLTESGDDKDNGSLFHYHHYHHRHHRFLHNGKYKGSSNLIKSSVCFRSAFILVSGNHLGVFGSLVLPVFGVLITVKGQVIGSQVKEVLTISIVS